MRQKQSESQQTHTCSQESEKHIQHEVKWRETSIVREYYVDNIVPWAYKQRHLVESFYKDASADDKSEQVESELKHFLLRPWTHTHTQQTAKLTMKKPK